MPTVTAVVCAYWSQRRQKIQRIVNDIRAGSVVPDHLMVLNNNPALSLAVEGAEVINAPANYWTRGKYVVALLHPADYYLLIDDDCSVGPDSLKCCLRYAKRGSCFGFAGIRLEKGEGGKLTFLESRPIMPGSIGQETVADVFWGRVMFMAHDAIVKVLAMEEWTRLPEGRFPYEGCDLLAGLANRATVIPMRGTEEFLDIGEEGISLWREPGFKPLRLEFLQVCLDAIGEHGKPSW